MTTICWRVAWNLELALVEGRVGMGLIEIFIIKQSLHAANLVIGQISYYLFSSARASKHLKNEDNILH